MQSQLNIFYWKYIFPEKMKRINLTFWSLETLSTSKNISWIGEGGNYYKNGRYRTSCVADAYENLMTDPQRHDLRPQEQPRESTAYLLSRD